MPRITFDTTGFEQVDGFPFAVHTTMGGSDRAQRLAVRTERVISWLTTIFPLLPTPPLFVLGPADWDQVALIPQYGLAHVDSHRIVMGLEPAPYWNGILDRVWPNVSIEERERLWSVYGKPLDLGVFADLVIAHELTHLGETPWLGEADSDPEYRRGVWFRELFANVGLQGYVTENEPDALPALETVYEVVWRTPSDSWPVRRLELMPDALTSGADDGANYVWFEYGLLTVAQRLWQAAGAPGLRHLHETLHRDTQPSHDQLLDAVGDVDPSAADLLRRWPSS